MCAPFSRLFRSCPPSLWIWWLFLVASAYSLGQWGDRAALGMNKWINSSHEENVWHLQGKPSSQQSFNYVTTPRVIYCLFVWLLKKLHQVRNVNGISVLHLVKNTWIPSGSSVFDGMVQFVVLEAFGVWAMGSHGAFECVPPPKAFLFVRCMTKICPVAPISLKNISHFVQQCPFIHSDLALWATKLQGAVISITEMF